MPKEHIEYGVGANTKPFKREMTSMEKFTKAVTKRMTSAFKTMGAAIVGVFSVQSIRSVASYAKSLETMSQVVGVSAEFMQKWQKATVKAGLAITASDTSLQRFSRRLGEAQGGTGVLVKTFDALGIEVRKSNGQFKSVEEVLFEFSESLKTVSTEQQKLAFVFTAFDSDGAKLGATMSNLKQRMDEQTAATNEQVLAVAELNYQWDLYLLKMKGGAVGVIAETAKLYEQQKKLNDTLREGDLEGHLDVIFGEDEVDTSRQLAKLDREKFSRLKQAKDNEIRAEQLKKELNDAELIANKKLTDEKRKQYEATLKETDAIYKSIKAVEDSQAKAKANRAKQESEIAGREDSRSGFSIGGILGGEAESIFNEFGLSDVGRQNVQTSQQIAQLERAGRAARFNGDNALSQRNFDEAEELRGGLKALTDDERNPMGRMNTELEDQTGLLKDLNDQLRNAIPVVLKAP